MGDVEVEARNRGLLGRSDGRIEGDVQVHSVASSEQLVHVGCEGKEGRI